MWTVASPLRDIWFLSYLGKDDSSNLILCVCVSVCARHENACAHTRVCVVDRKGLSLLHIFLHHLFKHFCP